MKETISALMDGELEGAAAREAIEALAHGGEPLDSWCTYHLIGDAMRDTPLLRAGFAARLAERLDSEPTVLAPRRLLRQPARWSALPAAAAASLAGVGLVAWLAFAPQQPQQPGVLAKAPVGQVATQAQASRAAAKAPDIIPLPSATPDYLLAHQGFSARVPLGMAPYARTVSDQVTGARK